MKTTILFAALALALIGSSQSVYAQAEALPNSPFTSPVMPVSPNASALSKFVDVPVSYYTGTPQISIPIFQAVAGSISLPVSIDYHGSGIKVDETASSVGLGWSLNAGGSISRSVHGLADESANGFFNKGYMLETPFVDCDDSNSLPCTYIRNIAFENTIDSEPDVFILNLPGGGGVKFSYDSSGSILMQRYQQISISHDSQMETWSVIASDGTSYQFGQWGIYGSKEQMTYTPEFGSPKTYNSSWHLSKIISPDKVDTIYFEYGYSENYQYDDQLQEGYYERDLVYMAINPLCVECDNLTRTQSYTGSTSGTQRLLSKITFSLGSIEFLQSNIGRYDIPGGYAYSRINIKRADANLVKYYTLEQGYFNGSRLKLTGIAEHGSDGTSLPPYLFEYDESYPLPPRNSFKQDHWGFFNNNTEDTFVPKIIEKPDGDFIMNTTGANRDADEMKSKSGMLTKLTYPTGGFDLFEFESHDISMVGNHTATEYYTETQTYSALSYVTRQDENTIATIQVQEPTLVQISGAVACHGLPNGGELGAGGASIEGPCSDPTRVCVSISWTCLANPIPELFLLEPGINYSIDVWSDYISEQVWANATLTIKFFKVRQVPYDQPLSVGGVRIKRISRYSASSATPKITRFKYQYTVNNQLASSGVLVRKPIYYSKYYGTKDLGGASPTIICPYDAGFSMPRISYGDGTHIGYRQVTVLNGENGENGSEVFKFTTAAQHPDVILFNFPFPPAESRDARRGLLTEHEVYDSSNFNVSQTLNTYDANFMKFAKALKAGMKLPRRNDRYATNYYVKDYYYDQYWQYPTTTTERIYSSAHNGTYAETITTNYYDRPTNHIQLTRKEKSMSDGTLSKMVYKYPQDYVVGSGLLGVNALVNSHILTIPVESQSWVFKAGAWKMAFGQIMDFETTFYKPSKVYSFETAAPVTSLNNEAMSGTQYLNLLSDLGRYQLRGDMQYTAGRISSQTKTFDIQNSYLWGIKKEHIIAEVTNSAPTAFSYTSFEEIGNEGNWLFNYTNQPTGKTGDKCHSLLGNTVTRTGLNSATQYVLSYWAKSGIPSISSGVLASNDAALADADGWRYFEKIITGVTGFSISGVSGVLLDELRLYPKGAQMKTYTYKPLIGLSSTVDASNKITYFEYDAFGRLVLTKDHGQNIVKHYKYHFKTP